MMKSKISLGIFALLLAATSNFASDFTLYVSPYGDDAAEGTSEKRPLKTMQRARDILRGRSEKDKKRRGVVNLCRHFLTLDQPLVLTPEDSGTTEAPIVFQAFKGSQIIVSGGHQIKRWTRAENGKLKAPLANADGSAFPPFHEIYVDWAPRPQTRVPQEGFFQVAGFAGANPNADYSTPADKFEFKRGDIDPKWTNPQDIEVVALHFWVDTHLPVASIDGEKNIVSFARKSRRKLTDDHSGKGARYYVQNVFEAMQPGDWYYNRTEKMLYYFPTSEYEYRAYASEDPVVVSGITEIHVPRLTSLIRFEGRPEKNEFVSNIHFKGLTFTHCAWELPPDDAGDLQSANTVPGAIIFAGARNCKLEKCTISGVQTYGVEIATGSREIWIDGCEITRTGAGGIKINGGATNSPEWQRTSGNVVRDCHIHHIGDIYHSGCGILSMHSADNLFSNNEIDHTYYTGISVGWVWGYKNSVSRDNIIQNNHIHHIGQKLLSDMGGIYMLGISPGTVIRGNVLHDIDSWGYGGWGIYTDEGSSEILIENNLVHHTKTGGFHQHYGKDNVVVNNIFAFAREAQIIRSREEVHNSFTFENNIVYWEGDGPLFGSVWANNNFKLNKNVYFNRNKPVKFAGGDFVAWQKRGHDAESIIADPLFVDADKNDFRLKDNSPALKLFKPFISAAGANRP